MEIPELYEVAKSVMLNMGLPYTDPRSGVTTKPTREQREANYNPGPSSKSRKARRKIGARDGRKLVEKTIKPSKPKSRRKADNKARRAIGARGAKTNSIRSGRN